MGLSKPGQRRKPPFRADHVGSLLRTAALKAARGRHERGEIGADELRAVEDEEIVRLIRRQEAVGLKSITDGEYRRASWQTDFLVGLDGVESYFGERKFKFQGPQPRPILLRLKGRLGGFSGHPMIEHFKFLAAHTKATPEDDDPVALDPAFPLWARGGAGDALPGHGRLLSRSRRHLSQGGARASPTPAAAISSSTRSISPISATPRCATRCARAATTPRPCRWSMPA